jgi:hypothetical protein
MMEVLPLLGEAAQAGQREETVMPTGNFVI